MDALIIHYNTPELTTAAIRSLWRHTPRVRVTVFDNSDRRPFDGSQFAIRDSQLVVIDNTQGQHIDFDRWLTKFPDKRAVTNAWGSAKHCKSVDYCMRMFPDGFLLMDSDILVKRDVTPLFDESKAWVGEVRLHHGWRHINIPRVMPMLCYINTRMCSMYGVPYINERKMLGLSHRIPDEGYDTGCWFLEAASAAGLPHTDINIDDYMLHFGSGSWKNKSNPAIWLHRHKNLWM